MKVIRGGIYILDNDYAQNQGLLENKRPIVALENGNGTGNIRAVRMGIFKSIRDREDNVLIEINDGKNKYFSTVLCSQIIKIPETAIKKEIGILDEVTLRTIDNKILEVRNKNCNYDIAEKDVYKKFKSLHEEKRFPQKTKNVDADTKIHAVVTVKDPAIFNIIKDTNEKVTFLAGEAIKTKKSIWNRVTRIIGGVAAFCGISGITLWGIINYEDNTSMSVSTNHIENTSEISFDFENMSEKELLRVAKVACLKEEYDYAYEIYSYDSVKSEPQALINLGYIYTHGLSYIGIDYQKAEMCYTQVECVEAKRNLFALYLKTHADEDKITDILNELLWKLNDDVTWNYITYTLYDQSSDEYFSKNTKEEIDVDINVLFEIRETSEEYRGYKPSKDIQEGMKWLPVGTEFDDNTPYTIWKLYETRYLSYLSLLEKMYYEEDGSLYPL